MATKLTTVPALTRIQNPNYHDWNTLRYDECGECEILAHYGWAARRVSANGGGLIVRHDGELKGAYLSQRENGEYVAVLSDYGHHAEAFDFVLSIAEGKNNQRHGDYVIDRYTAPTDESSVVIGLK